MKKDRARNYLKNEIIYVKTLIIKLNLCLELLLFLFFYFTPFCMPNLLIFLNCLYCLRADLLMNEHIRDTHQLYTRDDLD